LHLIAFCYLRYKNVPLVYRRRNGDDSGYNLRGSYNISGGQGDAAVPFGSSFEQTRALKMGDRWCCPSVANEVTPRVNVILIAKSKGLLK